MPIPLACDMSAIPAEERGAHHAIAQRLLSSATVVRDLVDGLAFQWPAAAYEDVTRFLDYERRCCPFLTISITASPGGGPLDVRLTGPEGTTAFLRAELQLPPA